MKDINSINKYLDLHNQVIQDLKDDKISITNAETKIKSLFNDYIVNITNPDIVIDDVLVQYSIIDDIECVKSFTNKLSSELNLLYISFVSLLTNKISRVLHKKLSIV